MVYGVRCCFFVSLRCNGKREEGDEGSRENAQIKPNEKLKPKGSKKGLFEV